MHARRRLSASPNDWLGGRPPGNSTTTETQYFAFFFQPFFSLLIASPFGYLLEKRASHSVALGGILVLFDRRGTGTRAGLGGCGTLAARFDGNGAF